MNYATGGPVFEPSAEKWTVAEEGTCATGHRLVRVNGGPIEHVVPPRVSLAEAMTVVECGSLG